MNHKEFLDDIEDDITDITDGYYSCQVKPIMQKIQNYLNVQHWNTAAHLPTPNIPLIIKLSDGTQVSGIRPKYVSSREQGDLGYRDMDGNVLMNVIEWTIA